MLVWVCASLHECVQVYMCVRSLCDLGMYLRRGLCVRLAFSVFSCVFCVFLVCFWCVFGVFLVCVLVCFWCVCGVFLVCCWYAFGMF